MSKLLSKSEGYNDNYLVKIVKLPVPIKHPNAEKLQIFLIDGRNIITDMSANEGDIKMLFPTGCVIDLNYLAENNDFRPNLNLNKNPEYNDITNPGTKLGGFFEASTRVKNLKLRQIASEGYAAPLSSLSYMLSEKEIKEIESLVDKEFDTVKDLKICQKYIPKNLQSQGIGSKQGKKAVESKIIPSQFRYHPDTSQLGKNMFKVTPNTWITLSDKWHGCNCVISNILCYKPLKWHEKILKKLGVNIINTQYDLVYSSRRVIKNEELNPNASHYYGTDVWGEVAKKIEPLLNKGESLIGEIVGYVGPSPIQSVGNKVYDYGCQPGTNKFVVFRITQTNADGKLYTLPFIQMQERCKLMGIETVPLLYTGYAKDLFPELDLNNHWHEEFLSKLKETYLEKKCTYCTTGVWAEGIVLTVEGALEPENLKLKSQNFLCAESDAMDKDGITDLEISQGI